MQSITRLIPQLLRGRGPGDPVPITVPVSIVLQDGEDGSAFLPPTPLPQGIKGLTIGAIGASVACPDPQEVVLNFNISVGAVPIVLAQQGTLGLITVAGANVPIRHYAAWQMFPIIDLIAGAGITALSFSLARSATGGMARANIIVLGYGFTVANAR